MRKRQCDKRYRDGVDKGRMATQSLPLPVKKDFKPSTTKPAETGITHTADGKVVIVDFETLPKQIQKHVLAKIRGDKLKKGRKYNTK